LSLDLDHRAGWPDELCVLLKQHPRESWSSKPTPLAQFWLDVHASFRHECQALETRTADYRAERLSPQQFGLWAAPRVQNLISHLHGHHQIEDYHYFPSFRSAEPRLANGFETLERDHATLNAGIRDVVETINAFIAALRVAEAGDVGAKKHIADRFVESSMLLYRRLGRHLDDEEDLIIPLMIERG
jgi:hypothetical protein